VFACVRSMSLLTSSFGVIYLFIFFLLCEKKEEKQKCVCLFRFRSVVLFVCCLFDGWGRLGRWRGGGTRVLKSIRLLSVERLRKRHSLLIARVILPVPSLVIVVGERHTHAESDKKRNLFLFDVETGKGTLLPHPQTILLKILFA
jgi:hypothetical protein